MPKRPIQTAWVNFEGTSTLLSTGEDDNYADDHPLVLQYPHMFRDVVVIEYATAAPGERRNTVRR